MNLREYYTKRYNDGAFTWDSIGEIEHLMDECCKHPIYMEHPYLINSEDEEEAFDFFLWYCDRDVSFANLTQWEIATEKGGVIISFDDDDVFNSNNQPSLPIK